MAVAGRYLTSADLIARINPTTFVAIFDDANTNDPDDVNDVSVLAVIHEAEAEVDSYLITQYPMPLPALVGGAIDRLVKLAALDFAQALAWRRHPEYVRSFGESHRADDLEVRARARMLRIQEAIQQLPDQAELNGQRPRNVGGLVFDDGPRTIIPWPDGTDNGGDF